jgi:hypothetical protein
MQTKSVSFRDILPQKIILISADHLHRYPVFLDRDIGIPKHFRQLTKENVDTIRDRWPTRTARALRTWWR